MWYLLIVAVAAGHIHQRIMIDKASDQPFTSKVECEKDLALVKKLKVKKGVKVYMTCAETSPPLNYYFAESRFLWGQHGDD